VTGHTSCRRARRRIRKKTYVKEKIVHSSDSSETTHILQESKKKEDKKYTSQAEIDQKLRELDRAKQKVLTLLVLLVHKYRY
jgi:hypothetical protein